MHHDTEHFVLKFLSVTEKSLKITIWHDVNKARFTLATEVVVRPTKGNCAWFIVDKESASQSVDLTSISSTSQTNSGAGTILGQGRARPKAATRNTVLREIFLGRGQQDSRHQSLVSSRITVLRPN